MDARKAHKEALALRARERGLLVADSSDSSDSGDQARGQSPSGESTDELTPLPEDAPAEARHVRSVSSPSFRSAPVFSPPESGSTNGGVRTPTGAQGLSELMSGSPHTRQREAEWYFSPMHLERSEGQSSSPSTSSTRFHDYSPNSSWTAPSDGTRKSSASGADAGAGAGARARSPRVRNTGKVLAPHGTFTSRAPARAPAPPEMADGSGTSTSGNESVRSHASRSSASQMTLMPGPPEPDLDPEERKALMRAAKRGDQLAMHRLGWLQRDRGLRHALGSVEDVWGPVQQGPTGVYRSNGSSMSSPAELGVASPRPALSPTASSDLFSDAARMTLQSNARENRAAPRDGARPSVRPRPKSRSKSQMDAMTGLATGSGRREREQGPGPGPGPGLGDESGSSSATVRPRQRASESDAFAGLSLGP